MKGHTCLYREERKTPAVRSPFVQKVAEGKASYELESKIDLYKEKLQGSQLGRC